MKLQEVSRRPELYCVNGLLEASCLPPEKKNKSCGNSSHKKGILLHTHIPAARRGPRVGPPRLGGVYLGYAKYWVPQIFGPASILQCLKY